jgi:DNA-3-methyladenine glycosylase
MLSLNRQFYDRPAATVARELLGQRLVRVENGLRLSGIITEAEAYQGEEDLGCHAHAGRTPRTSIMYGPPGHAYIYFTYGMHWCLNAVCMAEGIPAAVLIRSIQPVEGLDILPQHRPHLAFTRHWLDGPAKITQAMAINKDLNGVDLAGGAGGLFIESGAVIPHAIVLSGPRIGLNRVPEPWKSIPWRFWYNYPSK